MYDYTYKITPLTQPGIQENIIEWYEYINP